MWREIIAHTLKVVDKNKKGSTILLMPEFISPKNSKIRDKIGIIQTVVEFAGGVSLST